MIADPLPSLRDTALARRPSPSTHLSSTVRSLHFTPSSVCSYSSSFSLTVPRPLFVEEFGLKRLMQARGVALELDRTDFEAGRWEFHIAEAWERGFEAKEKARKEGYQDENAGEIIRGEIEKFLRERESV